MPSFAGDAGRGDPAEDGPEVLRADDVDAVVEIERVSFTTPWTRDQVLHQIRDARHGFNPALRAGGRPIAYACLRLIEGVAEVHTIAVSPDHRRQGLGDRLLRAALLEASRRGCATAILEVRPSNAAARRLYERLGFHRVGVRRGYYQDDGEDAWVLEVRLESVAPDAGETL